MRTRLLALSLLLPLLRAQEVAPPPPPPPPPPAVAVLAFDNLEAARPPADGNGPGKAWKLPADPLAEACRLAVEQLLVRRGSGLRVVDRHQLGKALEELELHQSPLVDQDTAVQFGKHVGARYLISGAIPPAEIKEVEVKAYDLDVKNTVAKASVLLKVLDVETSRVVFSETFTGSNTVRSTKYRKEEPKDKEQLLLPALRDALAAAGKSEALQKFLDQLDPAAKKPGMVTLELAPEPEGCDVEVDGLFVGNTPCKVELPLDQVVTLKLSKAGYASWEKQLKATPQLASRKIAPTLQRSDKPPEPGEGKLDR